MAIRFIVLFDLVATLVLGVAVSGGCNPSSGDVPSDAGSESGEHPDGGSDANPLDSQVDQGADSIPDGIGAGEGEPVSAGCVPGDLSGFQPPLFVPIAPPSHACDGFNGIGGLVQVYGDACLSRSATYESCGSLDSPDGGGATDCHACLVTPERSDASTYGVVVIATVPVVNYGACIQAVDPSNAGQSCARALYASAACAEYACKPSCPITDQTSQAAYVVCANAASTGPCLGYTLSSDSCVAAEQGDGGTPVATICFAGATALDHYLTVAHYFCGGN
jgi:hypothetical protein